VIGIGLIEKQEPDTNKLLSLSRGESVD